VLPKISENLNIPRKPLTLRSCAAKCLFLYISNVSQQAGVFISASVSEFWLFSLHRFHVCLLISKWWMLRSKVFALNFPSSSTQLHLKPIECYGGLWSASFKPSKNIWVVLCFSKLAGNLWKIINILIDRPYAQLRKWLRKCVKLS